MQDHGFRTYHSIDRVHYGVGSMGVIRNEMERRGWRRAFLIVSRTLANTSDVVQCVQRDLAEACVGHFDEMPAHTPREAVVAAAECARSVNADVIVTIGGGTVIDGAKVVRLCLSENVRTTSELDRFRIVTRPDGTRHLPDYEAPWIPQIAISTTLSAAEFTPIAGCTDRERGVKDLYKHPALVPSVIVLDAAATLPTPMRLWLGTGIRALDHAVETICAPTVDDYTMGTALHALRLLSEYLPHSYRDPKDLTARHKCFMAAWLSADHTMANVQTGASHGIGYILGSALHVPHGETSCVMLPATLRFNQRACPEAQQLVSATMGRPGVPAWQAVKEFVASLGLPTTLQEVGVGSESFGRIAAIAMQSHFIHSNPRPIRHEHEVTELLQLACQ